MSLTVLTDYYVSDRPTINDRVSFPRTTLMITSMNVTVLTNRSRVVVLFHLTASVRLFSADHHTVYPRVDRVTVSVRLFHDNLLLLIFVIQVILMNVSVNRNAIVIRLNANSNVHTPNHKFFIDNGDNVTPNHKVQKGHADTITRDHNTHKRYTNVITRNGEVVMVDHYIFAGDRKATTGYLNSVAGDGNILANVLSVVFIFCHVTDLYAMTGNGKSFERYP